MYRIFIIVFFAVFTCHVAYAQQRTAAASAMLQLTGLTFDGKEVTAQSQEMVILYEPGVAKGELSIQSLSSSDGSLDDLFRNSPDSKVLFIITIPEGKFAFGSTLEEEFDARGSITAGEVSSEFDIKFVVSHNKTEDQNTFLVMGQGRLSLSGHFNLSDTLGLQDSFTFIFTQNLKVFTP
jgi:hypothetical protein